MPAPKRARVADGALSGEGDNSSSSGRASASGSGAGAQQRENFSAATGEKMVADIMKWLAGDDDSVPMHEKVRRMHKFEDLMKDGFMQVGGTDITGHKIDIKKLLKDAGKSMDSGHNIDMGEVMGASGSGSGGGDKTPKVEKKK